MSHIAKKENQIEVQQLIDNLSNEDREVREEARKSLALMGEESLKPLTEALRTPDAKVRLEIIKTISEMLNPESAPILVKELENEDPDVRWLAAKGLLALGRKGLLPLLNALAKNPDSLWLRMGAHHVLSDFYSGEVHEDESGYQPIYNLNKKLKEALRPVLIAMESMDHSVLLPGASKKALEVLKSSNES